MVPDPQKHQIWIADANSQWHLKDIHKHKCGNKVICTNNSQQREGCQDVWHAKLPATFSARDLWNWQPFRIFHSLLHEGPERNQRWSATNTPRFLNLGATVNEELNNRIERALTWCKPRILIPDLQRSFRCDTVPALKKTEDSWQEWRWARKVCRRFRHSDIKESTPCESTISW